ncbi:hypothetical protein COCSUDRAFT_62829 [Coccomyxa subellipsoidea C-169]|uniref:Uncharacterized protein n=1 Tax=Coccomyxa subellipsoidea (strain C-169) TaxID=574566 RepID=I0Z111_COCSC|nr:hypothetical protein COCSUDRAFT_62829 [Coccomyxa subellipsoidea C-169]EIE24330.1 hypothetical protein COCSUDRAFT_62829 [Coccomyxa subellipsoidea C-169]|eukprot:XP_005648874.1 hypothetical protein COCSUDRAFT_62829 [Coccomyxa subellipsoidea C-169]
METEKERLLMSAPAGSALVLKPRPAELAPCALTPANAANPSFRQLLPFPFKFFSGPLDPYWPIGSDANDPFGRQAAHSMQLPDG